MSDAASILEILPDDSLRDIHQALVKELQSKRPSTILRRLVTSSASGASSTYEFEGTLADLARALRSQFQRRGMVMPGVTPMASPRRALTVNMPPRC